jgi:hypothetical protein
METQKPTITTSADPRIVLPLKKAQRDLSD